ncbi:MAG: DNA-3-methyladenine glycosylase 2 family protein, partial [Deltaproteobacteria bacterium]|nr:DNA-3-methyladenine glycosylase 2 family protein [Deltaproteobacteria bacterium]
MTPQRLCKPQWPTRGMVARMPEVDWTAALSHLTEADPALALVIAQHGVPTIAPTSDAIQSLARAIVGQQLSGAAARTIWGRVLALFPRGRFPGAAKLLETPDADLRGAGLSGAKTAALKDLARHVIEKRLVPKKLPAATDDEVSAMLLPIRGIGPWSVDMFLMFALARPDVL